MTHAQVILADMIPFMAILSCAIVGCMLFFTINRSSEPDELFTDLNNSTFGMLVTVYHMTLGIGGVAEINASPTTQVVVTLFTSFVVVVLCASAECCLLCTMPLVINL